MQPAKSTTEEEERGFCNQNLATPRGMHLPVISSAQLCCLMVKKFKISR